MNSIEPYGVIYMLLNKVNGKVYIGQSVKFEKRMRDYKTLNCKNQYHIYNALKIHGWNVFDKIILDTCYTNEGELTILEQFYMDKFNSLDRECGYNNREAGSGGKLSEETKKKLSEARIGKTASPDTRLKMSNTRNGMPRAEATKQKISASKTGKPRSEETKKKISQSLIGKIWPKRSNSRSKALICIETNESFESESDCATKMNLHQSSIHRNLQGKQKSVEGFHFRHIKKDDQS